MSSLPPVRRHKLNDFHCSHVEGSIAIDGTTHPKVVIPMKVRVGSRDSRCTALKTKIDYSDEETDISTPSARLPPSSLGMT
jgi:hypothetical protein